MIMQKPNVVRQKVLTKLIGDVLPSKLTMMNILNLPQEVADKYYISKGMNILANFVRSKDGKLVDCWFENDTHQEHRCLDLEDFRKINRVI